MMIYSKYSTISKGRKFQFVSTRRIGIIILILTTTALILLKVATWLNAQEMFILKAIQVEGNRFINKNELLEYVDLDSSATLFEFDLKKITSQVKEHPFVKDAWVSRRLPDNLVIKILEKEPLAILNHSKLAIVDENGDFLPELKSEEVLDYPVISNISLSENEKQNDKFNKLLSFLRYTKTHQFKLYCQISEISYSKNFGLYFYLIDEAIPVIVGDDGFEKKGAKLAEVLKILEKNKTLSQVRYFDLRYEDQVIVKEGTKS